MTKAQRQSLRAREAAKALDLLNGKQTIHQIRDHLKGLGLIVAPDNLLDIFELEQTRDFIQQARKYRNSEESACVDWVNLFEVGEDNVKSKYYKKTVECTHDEAKQFMIYLSKNRKYWDKQIRRYYRIFSATLGAEFQLDLPFGIEEPIGI